MLGNVARPAQRRDVRKVVGRTAMLKRPDVVRLKPPGMAAPLTAPAVALEARTPHPRPLAAIQRGMVARSRMLATHAPARPR